MGKRHTNKTPREDNKDGPTHQKNKKVSEMILLGLDFETSSPDPETCDITEAGWVAYDTLYGPVPILSGTFLNRDVEHIEPEAERITGISVEKCKKYGIQRKVIKDVFSADILKLEPDFLVAHNAHSFDRIIFDRIHEKTFGKIPWIDTMEDLPEETYEKCGTRKLSWMAAELGFINPFPHAALPDVMTMMKLLFMHDLDEVIALSKIPMVTIAADVTFQQKDLAKKRGYYWQNIRGREYPKKWVKRMKKDKVEVEQKEAPFSVAIID